jgi:PTS hybrid protein
LVLVSHSEKLAEGLAELAAQMAKDVTILPAGGTDDGRIGTSFEKVQEAVQKARSEGQDVVLLTDLGSATMTVESVLDFLDDDEKEHVVFAPGPFVEGAVAAAVGAQVGSSLTDIVKAAAAKELFA